ncbi:methyltransferase [Solwaraspora sp. WMMD791]|uniref:methyltransferase n=1 Tax=Solwaraspora sp. WMMD791 TaxID=3016086 RepID=UPI00249CEACD|nr:methyltransferase [Solwaraspora sp. WMMD791]WFE30118.1 methyltransferase [Solwaraspora sp. WMMD791]
MTSQADAANWPTYGRDDMPGSDAITLHHGTNAPAPVRMYEMLYSSLVSQLLVAVADIGVADAFGSLEEHCHVDELARRTGSDAAALYRALRALASVGVFTEVAPRTFRLTPLAATLRSDEHGSMRDLARYVGLPERQRAFGALAHSLRTGKPSFDQVHGTDWWTYFGARPELSALFNRAMGTMARMVNSATLEAHDLSDARRLVDVGGGKGLLVSTLLQRYPKLTAVVFDQPAVAAEAAEVLAAAGLQDRSECVGGDFFTSVPADGDVYVLSWTIHDWNDRDAIAILRNIRSAMREDGQLIVIDEVLPEGDAPHFGKFEDIVMLSLLNGHVRTEPEFVRLFEAAGLRHKETRGTPAPTSVIVAVPA